MTRAVDVRVTGMVQGVSFRACTRAEARRLGVSGWVRNEPDGSVAAHFEGPDRAVDALVFWCGHGPSHADVDRVDVREVEPSGVPGFEVRHG